MQPASHTAHLALAQVEQQLEAVTAALLRNDPNGIADATQQLRTVAMAFSRTIDSALAAARNDTALRQRIEAARTLLVQQREQITRGAARAEQAVRVLLPGTVAESPTYGRSGGTRANASRLYAAHG